MDSPPGRQVGSCAAGSAILWKTTPRPPAARQLSLLAATTTWTLLAYVLAGLYFGVSTALAATWGGPVAAPILIAALTVAVHTAIGYAAGSFAITTIQSRLTSAIVPVVLFLSELAPILFRGDDVEVGQNGRMSHYPYEKLSPVELVGGSGARSFWEPQTTLPGRLYSGWVALALCPLDSSPSGVGPAPLSVGPSSSSPLSPSYQAGPSSSPHPSPMFPAIQLPTIPSALERSIPICLHPAYESLLDETADFVEPIISPLVGIPGFPTRASQLPSSGDGLFGPDSAAIAAAPDTLSISPDCTRLSDQAEAAAVALAAIVVAKPDDPLSSANQAQTALAIWLLRQAGYAPGDQLKIGFCEAGGVGIRRAYVDAATLAAVDRFAALTPEAQHAWLVANFAWLPARNCRTRGFTVTVRDARLATLFLRSRQTGPISIALAAVAIAAGLGLAASNNDDLNRFLRMVAPLAVAVVIGAGAGSPFGEAERTASRPLPPVRFGHLVLLLATGAALLALADVAPADGGLGVLLRNGAGFVGLSLIGARLLGSGTFGWFRSPTRAPSLPISCQARPRRLLALAPPARGRRHIRVDNGGPPRRRRRCCCLVR